MTEHTLSDLQKRQVVHDRDYHRDIFFLPYPQRMTHFVLHFAKYVGRLAGRPLSRAELERTLADTVIVSLAASDVLNLHLDSEIKKSLQSNEIVKAQSMALEKIALPREHESLQRAWLLRLAAPTGTMGKAMESLDHMESLNVRDLLADALMEIVVSNLAVAEALGVDTRKLVTARWLDIEGRRLP